MKPSFVCVQLEKNTRYLLLALLISTIALSCKTPFSTRDPEEPNSNQSSWIQPTSPSFVLINLRNAIAEKNLSNYMRCLSDSSRTMKIFRFVADPSVAATNQGVFNRWDKDRELIFMSQLLSFLPKDSLSVLTLTPLKENAYQDSVILLQEYDLTMRYKCQEISGCPRKLIGQAEFHLTRTTEDLWYITLWRDRSLDTRPTWSELRVRFK